MYKQGNGLSVISYQDLPNFEWGRVAESIIKDNSSFI